MKTKKYFAMEDIYFNDQLLLKKGREVGIREYKFLKEKKLLNLVNSGRSYNESIKQSKNFGSALTNNSNRFECMPNSNSNKIYYKNPYELGLNSSRKKFFNTIESQNKMISEKIPNIDFDLIKKSSDCIIEALLKSRELIWGTHISALANYIDWLYSHTINVTILSTTIGYKMNLSNNALENLIVSSLLHDIGNILIPKSILNKTGSLTEEEWKIIKQHPQIGYDMLLGTDLPAEVIIPVLQHHKRIDQSGYPEGKVAHISCASQIIAIADSFDSMTSTRPYRSAMSTSEALNDMKNKEGISYDKNLLQVFFSLIKF